MGSGPGGTLDSSVDAVVKRFLEGAEDPSEVNSFGSEFGRFNVNAVSVPPDLMCKFGDVVTLASFRQARGLLSLGDFVALFVWFARRGKVVGVELQYAFGGGWSLVEADTGQSSSVVSQMIRTLVEYFYLKKEGVSHESDLQWFQSRMGRKYPRCGVSGCDGIDWCSHLEVVWRDSVD
jgi:hypothetical protein